jgi:hypothetical protein
MRVGTERYIGPNIQRCATGKDPAMWRSFKNKGSNEGSYMLTIKSFDAYKKALADCEEKAGYDNKKATQVGIERARELRGFRIAAGLNVLLLTAARGELISYGEFDNAIRSSSRYESDHILREILKICLANSWSILPVLLFSVSADNNYPSAGLNAELLKVGWCSDNLMHSDYDEMRAQCYSHRLPDPGEVFVPLARWRLGAFNDKKS